MNHHQDYINAIALIAFALGFLGGMLWVVIGFRIGRWIKLRKIRRKRKMFWIRLRVLWMVALLCLTSQSSANELSLDTAVAIARATLAIKVTPPKVVPTKASGKVEWLSYKNAHKAYLENKQPLFVMIGAEWCGPCKSLKSAVEKANVPGVNYAYVDVDKEPKNVAVLGFSGTFTIPKATIYSMLATKSLDTTSHEKVISGITQYAHYGTADTSPEYAATVSKKAAEPYSYRVVRVARPVGFQPAYVAGQTFYTHIVRDHGHQIREVLNRVDIRGMSEDELFSLHSCLHSGVRVGHWVGRCFIFELP
jgi:thiol-disulfide isomerase/thioredoxin